MCVCPSFGKHSLIALTFTEIHRNLCSLIALCHSHLYRISSPATIGAPRKITESPVLHVTGPWAQVWTRVKRVQELSPYWSINCRHVGHSLRSVTCFLGFHISQNLEIRKVGNVKPANLEFFGGIWGKHCPNAQTCNILSKHTARAWAWLHIEDHC